MTDQKMSSNATPRGGAADVTPVRWWRSWWSVALQAALLSGAVLFAGGNWIVMPLVTRGSKTVIPDLYDVDVAVSKSALRRGSLVFVNDSTDYVWDEEVAANRAVRQEPAPYTVVKEGRRVHVVLSRGPQLYAVPDLRNSSATAARLRLAQEGFRVGAVALKLRRRDDRSEPLVIAQVPRAGEMRTRLTRVDVTVDVAPLMPDLSARSYREATELVQRMGLVIGSTVYERNDVLLPYSVVSQSIQPGTRIHVSDVVDLVLSHL